MDNETLIEINKEQYNVLRQYYYIIDTFRTWIKEELKNNNYAYCYNASLELIKQKFEEIIKESKDNI